MRILWQLGKQTKSIGRNGIIKTTGVEVTKRYDNSVDIEPVDSRGRVANCTITLADDPDALRDIAQVLLTISKNLRSQRKKG